MSQNVSIENKQINHVHKSPFFYIGGVLLLISIAASLVLAGTKLGIFTTLPGCGVGSGCDAVTNGPWGTIPGIGWPVSFLGLAWFTSLFVGWVREDFKSQGFVWIIRIGVIASVGFFFVMFGIGHFCKWCALAHVCNILFWIIAEIEHKKHWSNNREGQQLVRASVPFFAVFVFVFILLGVVMFFVSSAQKQKDEAAGQKNVDEVVHGSADESTLKLLEATHRIGPEDALVQIVIFTDYQCPDCKRYEKQFNEVVSSRDDVSLSVKHFPMCADCNEHMNGKTLHSNACWAARAAEAAFIVGGQEGWEKMHSWLFEQSGRFTDKSLPIALSELGFNTKEFIKVMTSKETFNRVQKNTNDAVALGISFTPMIFVNGVEYLWYYGGKQTPINELVDLAIEEINNGGGGVVAPPDASERLVEDWRRGRTFNPPGHRSLTWAGDGPVEIVVWGDYQQPFSVEVNSVIQELLDEDSSKISYAFRPFPVDESCNAGVSGYPQKYNGSCRLSKLVEAVNLLSGPDARWEMHRWIFNQTAPVGLKEATDMALSITGVDIGVLEDVINNVDVNNRLRVDIMSKNGVWKRGLPVVTINGRRVPKWKSQNVTAREFFQRIVGIAESENQGGSGDSDGESR